MLALNCPLYFLLLRLKLAQNWFGTNFWKYCCQSAFVGVFAGPSHFGAIFLGSVPFTTRGLSQAFLKCQLPILSFCDMSIIA